ARRPFRAARSSTPSTRGAATTAPTERRSNRSRVAADRQTGGRRQARTRSPAQRPGHGEERRVRRRRPPRPRRHGLAGRLRERAAPARAVGAREAPDRQRESDRVAAPRQVERAPPVAAVNPPAQL